MKATLKRIAARLMRPGLSEVNERLARIEQTLAGNSAHATPASKMEGEMQFWRWLVREGGDREKFGESFETMFGRWQRERLDQLARYLDLQDADIDAWCATRAVVEIGSGPYPAAAAARNGWRQAIAVDPLAKGYVEEGLVPDAASGIVFLESGGERIPLPASAFDLVIIENCLDHVEDPEGVVTEMLRLLRPGGLLWFFVDLSNHSDEMHPHPMNEKRVLNLLSAFELVRGEVSENKAHPEAYGSYRGLFRKPGPQDQGNPKVTVRSAHAETASATT